MSSPTSTPVICKPAADWLTLCTFNYQAMLSAMAHLRGKPGKWSAAKRMQYTGKKSGNIFYGQATQHEREHYMIVVSGSDAQTFLDTWLTFNFADDFYCTRLDVQVTRSVPDWWNVRLLHDECMESGATVSMIQSESGNTLYLGSRRSQRFIRIYEKELAELMLRLEFELKGDNARLAYYYLLEGGHIGDIFGTHLTRAQMPQKVKDSYYPIYSTVEFGKLAHETDMLRKYKWLESLVPTFVKMSNDHDIGNRVRELFWSLSIDNRSDADYITL